MKKQNAARRTCLRSGLLLTAALAGIDGILPARAFGQLSFLNAWGSGGTGNGEFNDPDGVAVGPTGTVYVADTGNNRVETFSSTGAFESTFGTAGTGNGQFDEPKAVAVGSTGNVYVTDTFNSRVETFSSTGAFESTFGTSGSGNGDFDFPDGVTVGPTGTVYVADTFNNRVETFSSNGTFQSTFGTSGTGNGQFVLPNGVTVGPTGTVYVADLGNDRVESFSSTGTFQSTFGSEGSGNGQFLGLGGVAVGPTGTAYVTDSGNDRIETFTPSSTFLGTFGGAGAGNGQFESPSGVAVVPNGIVYVLDSGNDRVERLFDPSAWVGGTNTFTDPSVGPTTLDVGPGEILGTSLNLASSMALVANVVNIDSDGSLTMSGGSLSAGTLQINSGGTLSATSFTVGAGQTVNQTGGVSDVSNLTITSGNYNFSGGAITVGSLDTSGVPSNFNWTGGSLTVTGEPIDFIALNDPYNANPFGTILTLNNGMNLTVTSEWEWLAAPGAAVKQNAGSTNTAPALYVGGSSANPAVYILGGGTLTTNNEYIGYIGTGNNGGQGSFSQGGGTNNVGGLYVGYNAAGTYNMIAGQLNAGYTVNNGTIILAGGTSTLGNLSGTGQLIVGQSGAGQALVNAASLIQNMVTINPTGKLTIAGPRNTVDSLSITGAGTLDITNSNLFINYGTGPDPIASIEQWIKNGFYGLSGPQIISSSIATDDAASGLSYGIGYADSADPGNPANLPTDTIEIAYTLLGDANLDGTVNAEDFTPFSHNLNQPGGWDQGDFNYDGTVNAEDFTAFSHNLGQTAALAGTLDAANTINLANVPEPASGGMMVMAGLGILRRRRKRSLR